MRKSVELCRQQLGPCQFSGVLALLVLSLFPDVVSGTNSFFYRDFGVWAYPNAVYHRDCFWRGEVPLWNPYNNSGLPFLAQWNTLILYPLSLIYLLLPLSWSLNLYCLFHLWLAGVGMYLLAHRWTRDGLAAGVAGMAYALNGLTLHSLMWPNNIAALGWLPFVILLFEKARQVGGKWVAFAAVTGAIQMLAGAPEIILLTWLVAAVLLVVDLIRQRRFTFKAVSRFGCVAALTGLLCAVQLLPFIDLMGISQRSVTFGDSTWSMPAWGWANFFVPLFHQSKSVIGVYSQDDQQWTSSYYAGIGVVALALLAVLRVPDLRVRVLAGLGLFGLLMSMGENTPVYRVLKTILPQLGFARFPIKFVVLSIATLPLLAAFAVRTLRRNSPDRAKSIRTLRGVWIMILILVVAIVWTAHVRPALNESWNVTIVSAITRLAFLSLILGALLLPDKLRAGKTRVAVQWLVILLIGVDTATHAPRQNPTIASAALKPGATGLTGMPGLGQGRVMLSAETRAFLDRAATANLEQYYLGQRTALFANCNLINRIPKIDGFFSLYLREEALVRSMFAHPANPFPSGLADFLGVHRISSSNEIFGWTNRSTALPMITAGQKAIQADVPATLNGLASPYFNPIEVVYLPEGISNPIRATDRSDARIEHTHISAHRIDVTMHCRTPTLLVAAQTFSPSWRAQVNGHSAPLLRANHAFQAVEVPDGQTVVTLLYRDQPFRLGFVISQLAFVGCVIAFKRQSNQADGAR